MSIFDSLKSLVVRGPDPEPAPVADGAPAPELIDPHSVGETDPRVHNMVAPEPAPVAVVIPDLSGLSSAGTASAVPVQSEPAVEEVSFVPDDYGQNPERPVVDEEELDDDLPPRTRQRIAFLLRTHEFGDMSKTLRRIESDKVRIMNAKMRRAGPKKPISRAANPQAHLKDPAAVTPSKTTWT